MILSSCVEFVIFQSSTSVDLSSQLLSPWTENGLKDKFGATMLISNFLNIQIQSSSPSLSRVKAAEN